MITPMIVVTGPPRSGVYVLAQCLRMLGLHSADDQIQTDASTINQLLFQDLNHFPTMTGPLPSGWIDSDGAVRAEERINNLLANCQGTPHSLFLADPLLCRVLPLWLRVFQERGIDLQYIHISRHPYEVAHSLQEKLETDLTKGHLIWWQYFRDFLNNCPNNKSVFLTFDQLLADPITSLDKIGKRLGGNLLIDFYSVRHNLLDYVQPDLKHYHAGSASVQDKIYFAPFTKYYESIRLRQFEDIDNLKHVPIQNTGLSEVEYSTPEQNSLTDIILEVLGRYEHKEYNFNLIKDYSTGISQIEQKYFAEFLVPIFSDDYTKKRVSLTIDTWQKVTLNIPRPRLLKEKFLKFFPLNTKGLITISSMKFVNLDTGDIVWDSETIKDKNFLNVEGTALQIPYKDILTFLITGEKPVITITVGTNFPDSPLQLEIWLKATTNQSSYNDKLQIFLDLRGWKMLLGTELQDSNSDILLRLASTFEDSGFLVEADAVLRKGIDYFPKNNSLQIAFAELATKRKDWPEAVRRWQEIAALKGGSLLGRAFKQIDEAYQKQKSPAKEYLELSGSVIPSPDRRYCGDQFKDNDFYLKSCEDEADRLINNFKCSKTTRIFDVGCGQGRLAIGLLRILGSINYQGSDVDRKSVYWCKRYIQQNHSFFNFKYLDVYNERYNKNGKKIDKDFRFELKNNSTDIIYLFSVFSHTTEEDMKVYLKDFFRILGVNGRVFFTGFIEENVPNITINPENYKLKCSGPLHIVRYNKTYLFSLIDEIGYSILNFSYGSEVDGQSAIYLCKKNI